MMLHRQKVTMSKPKNALRVVNSESTSKKADVPWFMIAATGAVISVAGFAAVEAFKYFWKKAKAGEEKQANPVFQLPGATSPGMFQSPYAQMASQGFPSPFQNPMLMPEESQEPPKWFAQFQEVQDRRFAALEGRGRMAVVQDVDDEYEEDDEVG